MPTITVLADARSVLRSQLMNAVRKKITILNLVGTRVFSSAGEIQPRSVWA
jgi:hypothetical protein